MDSDKPTNSQPDEPQSTSPPRSQPVIHQAVPATGRRLGVKQIRLLWAGAAVVLLAGLGYFIWYKPSQPDMVLADSLMKTVQFETVSVKAELDTAANSGGSGTDTNKVTAKGVFDSKGAFSVSGDYGNKSGKLNFDVRSTNGQDFYAKFSGLQALPTLLGPDAGQFGITNQQNPFKSLEGTWLEIPKDTKDSLLKNTEVGSAPSQLNDKDKQAVARAYQQYPFLHVSKVAADETIDGKACRHYEVTIDKAKLVAFADNVKRSVPSLNITDQKLQSIRDAKAPSQPVDVWIARDSGFISQISFNDTAAKTSLKINFEQFNQPVNVQKPQDAKQFFEALGSAIFSGLQVPTAQ